MSSIRKSTRIIKKKQHENKLNLILKTCDLSLLQLCVNKTKEMGRGVFCTSDIQKGDPVMEYVGEKLNQKEAKERFKEIGDTGDIYI
jgi:SET domain-containing protein